MLTQPSGGFASIQLSFRSSVLKLVACCFYLCLLVTKASFAQQASGIAEIDKALTEKKIDRATALLQKWTDTWFAAQQADSLVAYIFYTGKVAQAQTGTDGAVKKVQLFIDKIRNLSPGAATLRQSYIEAGEYYGAIGKNSLAYKANQDAYQYTLQLPVSRPALLGAIENNLSTYAHRMGNAERSEQHTRRALKALLADARPDNEALYIAYNGMGSNLWFASKTDSALHFFNLALQALAKTERTPLNQYYRPAIVQNNISALYSLQGKSTEAIRAMQLCIGSIKDFLATPEPHPKKQTALTFQLEATDNLAGIYKELGDLKKAQALLEYSYAQKQKTLTKEAPAIFISQILLGQLYYAMREGDKAQQYLQSGLEGISHSDGDYLFWQADANSTLASLYNDRHNIPLAARYYEKTDSLYEASLQGEYDNIYLEFLRNAAQFYAANGQLTTAMARADKGYRYVVKTNGAASLPAFDQLLNLAEVNYSGGHFKEALAYSNQGLKIVAHNISKSNNLLDSVRMELKKPKAILLRAKAEYNLLPQKNVQTLTPLLTRLHEALDVLERRKTIFSTPEDVGWLMSDHSDLLQFVKKITLDLYRLTHDQSYINIIMSLHESGIYNRIRARLDKSDSIQFAHLPAGTAATERSLKAALAAALQGEAPHDVKMQRYFAATGQWNRYLEKLRVEQPRYYAMRYASIFKSLNNIQASIPAHTTLIRYLFIDKDLFALVADKEQKAIYPLQSGALEQLINIITQPDNNERKTAEALHALHHQLWAPLSAGIRYKKIIILPDGILYNLNFEILTPQKINSFRELAAHSLLTNYTISYQYSLFLLQQKADAAKPGQNFVAFAPGFSDKVKEDYRVAAKNRAEVDQDYLSLLPQPFTLNLATQTQQLLGGSAFINNQSTAGSFRTNAGHHKIIHIGTHAESNNDHPEFSRLIFAKDPAAGGEDNSVYVADIYNCDLTSNLTILAACESGKPGYEDGEGMISLAHAFNYAGSESILTGLWKIDEQSSAALVQTFYQYLLKGLPKDEALRQAKLDYLKQADGRALAPQYWAGLVIMGNTSPVTLETKKNHTPWIITGAVMLLALAGGIFWKILRRKKMQ